MRRFFVPPFWAAVLVASILFGIAAWFTSSSELSQIIRVFQIPLSLGVLASYSHSPNVARMSMSRRLDGTEQLTLGIVCSWVGFIGAALWSLLFRLAGSPPWMINTDVINGFAWLSCFGAGMHVTAHNTVPGIPHRSKLLARGLIGLAMAGLLALLLLRPDISGFADRLRPYLEDRRALHHQNPSSDLHDARATRVRGI